MTATVDQVLTVARHEIGYVESGGSDGHSGNVTKYWAELKASFQGQPWCACFQRWVDKHAGAPLLPVSNPYYCPSLVTYAKQHGLWIAAKDLTPGDYYFCDFSGKGVAEHVGRCELSPHDGGVTGIEGNTSAGSTGSQRDGGGVRRRTRNFGVILGGLDYSKLLAHAAATGTAPRNPVKHNPYTAPSATIAKGCKSDAVTHTTRVHYVQWAVGVPCDGTFGDQTDHAVREFQRHHGLTADGIVGPKTLAELAKVTH